MRTQGAKELKQLRTGAMYEAVGRGKLKLLRVDAAGEDDVAFTYLATWNQDRGSWQANDPLKQSAVGKLRLLARIAEARTYLRRRLAAPPLRIKRVYEVGIYNALHLVRLSAATSTAVTFERVATWSEQGYYLPAPLTKRMPLEVFRQLLQAAYDRSAS